MKVQIQPNELYISILSTTKYIRVYIDAKKTGDQRFRRTYIIYTTNVKLTRPRIKNAKSIGAPKE